MTLYQEYQQSRIAPPAIAKNDLVRMRIGQELNQITEKRLTILVAKNGTGKTTAVRHWDHYSPHKSAWFTAAQTDNDPAIFLELFIAALQTLHPQVGQDVFEQLRSENRPPIEEILKGMLGQLGMVLSQFAVIIDQYEQLRTTPVQNLITFFIANMPPQCHLVLISETEPTLPLAELRSADQLLELRGPFLAFTMEEGQALYNDVFKLQAAFGDITALVAGAKANAANLKYAGLALRDNPEAKSFIEKFEGADDATYQVTLDVLLPRFSGDQQRFLLLTSVLEELHPELAAAVSGYDEAGEWLAQWAEAGTLVERTTGPGTWYRMHPFIRQEFRLRLRDTMARAEEKLNLLAAQWYRGEGFVEQAFRHLLAAEDLQGAADLVEAYAMGYLQRGRMFTVEHWIASLPQLLTAGRAMLSVICAWIMIISGTAKGVPHHLENARNALQKNPPENHDEVLGYITAIEGYLAEKLGGETEGQHL
ncbi:MAG TPA: hypothetical protein PKV71_11060 [Calditrichia bacterium]|nr:hypothetical protein [Calditrichota bacterium]HQU71906.1 hypothetical protein [Calditrichia bacterium]HQV32410.1 hypothetical protein [Calditrichia bacterium]